MFTQEIAAHVTALNQLQQSVDRYTNLAKAAFEELGVREFYNSNLSLILDLGLRDVGTPQARSYRHSDLGRLEEKVTYKIGENKRIFGEYSRYLARKNNSS
jgi:hypothetical protein